jgi:hypothetical protein
MRLGDSGKSRLEVEDGAAARLACLARFAILNGFKPRDRHRQLDTFQSRKIGFIFRQPPKVLVFGYSG